MRFLLFVCVYLICLSFSSIAQKVVDPIYLASTIPDSLKKGVHAVVRVSETEVLLSSSTEVTQRHRRVITILSKEGFEQGILRVYYSSFSKVGSIKSRVWNEHGELQDKLAKSDIVDLKAFSASNFLDDHRFKGVSLEASAYPYTVEHVWETTSSESFLLPLWSPYENSNQSVQSANFSISIPSNSRIGYKCYNSMPKPIIEELEGFTTYKWHLEGLKKIPYEPLAYLSQEPFVRIASESFEIGGYVGSTKSWKEYGDWYSKLYSGRDQISASMSEKVETITKSLSEPARKVEAIYKMLQDETRYVSVQLGVGGWQPFPASYVEERGYGDCKALANYMQALLKVVDIPSYQVLVKAGSDEEDIDTVFVDNQFNHVIVLVPLKQDSIWLDCTSSLHPTNQLGDFTENRHALAIIPGDSKIVATPRTSYRKNSWTQHLNVVLTPDGNASINLLRTTTGYQADDHRILAEMNVEQQENWLRNRFSFLGNFKLVSKDYSSAKNRDEQVKVALNIALPSYASKAATRLIIKPNVANRQQFVPQPVQGRKQPARYAYPYEDRDTVRIVIPEDRVVKSVPQPIQLDTDFAHYEASFEYNPDDNVLMYYRLFQYRSHEFSPEKYNDLREFLDAVMKADNTQVVLFPGT